MHTLKHRPKRQPGWGLNKDPEIGIYKTSAKETARPTRRLSAWLHYRWHLISLLYSITNQIILMISKVIKFLFEESIITQLNQGVLILPAWLSLVQRLKRLLQINIHALKEGSNLCGLPIVFRQMLQAASEDLFKISNALGVISEYLIQQSDGVVGSHDRSKDDRSLLLLISLFEMFWVYPLVL